MISAFNFFTGVLTAVTLYGTILNGRQKISGFYVWAICNFFWIMVALYKDIPPQAFMYFVMLGLNIYGILCWKYKTEVVEAKIKNFLLKLNFFKKQF